MKAGKHTPGPWTAIYTPAMNLAGVHIRDQRGESLEIRYCNTEGEERPEADARLIAAAPDMLEALDVVRGCLASIDIECLSRSDRREIEKAEAYIEDALAKARGES